jgi:hypothetical protein
MKYKIVQQPSDDIAAPSTTLVAGLTKDEAESALIWFCDKHFDSVSDDMAIGESVLSGWTIFTDANGWEHIITDISVIRTD